MEEMRTTHSHCSLHSLKGTRPTCLSTSPLTRVWQTGCAADLEAFVQQQCLTASQRSTVHPQDDEKEPAIALASIMCKPPTSSASICLTHPQLAASALSNTDTSHWFPEAVRAPRTPTLKDPSQRPFAAKQPASAAHLSSVHG